MQAWTANYVRKHLWRTPHLGDYQDAMQECWIVFDRCARTYSGVVDNPAWFMSLYKRAITAQFHDFSNDATKRKHVVAAGDLVIEEDDAPAVQLDPVGELQNAGELCVKVRQAPSEVKAVLSILFNAPTEILDLVSDAFNSGVRGRAAGNRRLCMLIGVSEEADLLGRVREYFE